MTDVLGPASRERNLERLDSETFDVVVIGGGITGVGCALDAATRGLSVALVEQRDIAAGTSSRSSKLIHGGLRYLEQLDFGLVREALRERSLLLNALCPHLVRPVSFLYPLRHRVWERPYVGAGIALYDLLAATGDNPLPRHRHFSRHGASAVVPALRPDRFTGAVRYWDAQVDDARHSVSVARTAAVHGAVVLTSTRVVGIHQVGPDRRVHGLSVADLESGAVIDVQARAIVNATGVWTDRIQDMVGRSDINVRASKGVHILVRRDRIPSESGLILRTETSVLFVIPWGDHWIIGTTDTDWDLDLAHPAASQRDVDYLLGHLNTLLRDPLSRDDIVGVYAGLRPLLHGESEATSKLSREHAVSEPVPGFFTVAGGKYTTYRVMARDTIDAVARRAGFSGRSVTDVVPLVGAAGWERSRAQRVQRARTHGLGLRTVDHLIGRYGAESDELFATIAADPSLAAPLPGAPHYLEAEVRRAATHEGALHLGDVLTRRTRISIEADDRGLAAAEVAGRLMAPVLGWDEADLDRELWHYRARVDAERDAQSQPDDATVDAARLGRPMCEPGWTDLYPDPGRDRTPSRSPHVACPAPRPRRISTVQRSIFDEEHDMFRDAFRSFLEREVVPHFETWEKEGITPREMVLSAGAAGFLCMAAPPEYGGAGVDDFRYNLITNEEVQRAQVTGAGTVLTLHNDVCAPYILKGTTDEQKARWLPGMCSGELLTAICMTEPAAGSDLAGMKTTAIRDGDVYVVNGSKTFITNGINADLAITAVKTDPQERHKGMSMLVIEEGMEGFTRGRNLEKIGMHSQDTAELFFDDVRVPAENLLGEEGTGFLQLVDKLPQERLSIATAAISAARTALTFTLEYCKEREAFGKPIGSFQNTRFRLAEMQTEITIGERFIDDCVMALSDGELTAEEAAMAKWWTTELQKRVVDTCLQLHGGYGYMLEYPIARAYVDARIQTIYGGTTEIMKEIIGRGMGV